MTRIARTSSCCFLSALIIYVCIVQQISYNPFRFTDFSFGPKRYRWLLSENSNANSCGSSSLSLSLRTTCPEVKCEERQVMKPLLECRGCVKSATRLDCTALHCKLSSNRVLYFQSGPVISGDRCFRMCKVQWSRVQYSNRCVKTESILECTHSFEWQWPIGRTCVEYSQVLRFGQRDTQRPGRRADCPVRSGPVRSERCAQRSAACERTHPIRYSTVLYRRELCNASTFVTEKLEFETFRREMAAAAAAAEAEEWSGSHAMARRQEERS